MTSEEHTARHKTLHAAFDELLADYLRHHPGSLPSTMTILQLVKWSHEQTIKATELTP